MSRIPLLLLVLTELMRVRTATLTPDPPSLKTKLEKLYERLESLNLPTTESLVQKYAAKIDQLNAIAPSDINEELLTDDDEELLTAMQLWAAMSPDQLGGMAKELQRMRLEGEEQKTFDESDDPEELGWNDDEPIDYPMDSDDWDQDDDMSDATPSPRPLTPSSIIIRPGASFFAPPPSIDPIAATNQRPRILDDSSLSNSERKELRRAAITNMGTVVHAGRCLTPQPRWLTVRQMAPASDIVYMPPCVLLHRCAPDAGCCDSEADVCAPAEGKFVAIPFFLHKVDGDHVVQRIQFYNHTRCACVARDSALRRAASPVALPAHPAHPPPQAWPALTEEPRDTEDHEDEATGPPMMRRCTCPTLFLARMGDSGSCACVCEWAEPARRRDCLSLSRGREHFGLRDRVCISNRDCTQPTCEYGTYDRATGRCPLRKFRRVRYHGKSSRARGPGEQFRDQLSGTTGPAKDTKRRTM